MADDVERPPPHDLDRSADLGLGDLGLTLVRFDRDDGDRRGLGLGGAARRFRVSPPLRRFTTLELGEASEELPVLARHVERLVGVLLLLEQRSVLADLDDLPELCEELRGRIARRDADLSTDLLRDRSDRLEDAEASGEHLLPERTIGGLFDRPLLLCAATMMVKRPNLALERHSLEEVARPDDLLEGRRGTAGHGVEGLGSLGGIVTDPPHDLFEGDADRGRQLRGSDALEGDAPPADAAGGTRAQLSETRENVH